MTKRTIHAIAVNDEDEADLQMIKKHTGKGPTKLLRAKIKELKKMLPVEIINNEEDI